MKTQLTSLAAISAALFASTAALSGAFTAPQIISFTGDSDGTYTDLFPGSNINQSFVIPLSGFSKFDPSLGILNAVEVSIDVEATVSVAVDSQSIIDDQSLFSLLLDDTDSLIQVSATYSPGGGTTALALTFDVGGFGIVGNSDVDPADYSFPDFDYFEFTMDSFGGFSFGGSTPSEGTLLTSDTDYIASDFEGIGLVDTLDILYFAEVIAGQFSFEFNNLDQAFIEVNIELSGGDASLVYDYTPVPEPSSFPFLLGGVVSMWAVLRRRR